MGKMTSVPTPTLFCVRVRVRVRATLPSFHPEYFFDPTAGSGPCDGIDPEKQPCCKLSDYSEQAKCLGKMSSVPTGYQPVVSHVFSARFNLNHHACVHAFQHGPVHNCCHASHVNVGAVKTVDWKVGMPWGERSVVMQSDGKTPSVLTFKWSNGNHNVFQFNNQNAFKKCDFSRATQRATKSPYIFSTTKPGTYYFGCDMYGHCSGGQKLKFQVVSAPTSASNTPCQSKAEGEFLPQAK